MIFEKVIMNTANKLLLNNTVKKIIYFICINQFGDDNMKICLVKIRTRYV